MATFDNFFIAEGPGPIFAGLQSIPFDDRTAQFRVGVYATGTSAGLQGIALSNPGDTIDVPVFGPAGVYGASVTSPGVTGWSNQNDRGFLVTDLGSIRHLARQRPRHPAQDGDTGSGAAGAPGLRHLAERHPGQCGTESSWRPGCRRLGADDASARHDQG